MRIYPSFVLIMALVLVIALACSGGSEPATPSSETVSPLSQFRPDEVPLIEGPVSPEGLQAVFATSDLGLGENRIGFVVISERGLVRLPEIEVSSFYFPTAGASGDLKETTQAVFRPWPYGTRGLYTTQLSFNKAGAWGLEIDIPGPEEIKGIATLSFPVAEAPTTVAMGSPAVKSRSKTLDDVEGIDQLTTGSLQDPELYQLSIAEAVAGDLPTVVVMASPVFCTNAVCGPQVQVLQQLKEEYRGLSNFIHVDIYDNPHEIQGDLDAAVLSPVAMEWMLPSTEWSFVIDRAGIASPPALRILCHLRSWLKPWKRCCKARPALLKHWQRS